MAYGESKSQQPKMFGNYSTGYTKCTDFHVPNTDSYVGDEDRTKVADILSSSMSSGFITVDEFEDRMIKCSSARTEKDLAVLLARIPVKTLTAAVDPVQAYKNPYKTRKVEVSTYWYGILLAAFVLFCFRIFFDFLGWFIMIV